ncbi:hypothetical protein J23TS9_01670 [Paenibacillus sp. J23TS9]|uniref:hypothetical protein n=1 Tax=Paenibacillus sp. J23TS9 TaxID=2807193 RepID=UPI001B29B76D|nr:hypothetical protein [Paenibacillus sp. J23TS9]GIP25037.1 hypothetical protein J23TS9_01670 [Paenibacillus sp. J23TS9]
MFNLSVIYDYNYDGVYPTWMVIKPESGYINWSAETLYVHIEAPFQRLSRDEINDYALGLSIVQTDLVMSVKHPDHFGIYMPRVKKRLNQIRGEQYTPSFRLADIEHFIVQMSDIEIVMNMSISTRFALNKFKSRSQVDETDF